MESNLVILHGLLELVEINRQAFPGYCIAANLNVIICKRILSTIREQLESNPIEPIRLESFIHDFALLRMLEYSNDPVIFICVNMNNESLQLVQLAYPPESGYIYDNVTESEVLAKYPEYFDIKSTSLVSSPATSPLPKPPRMHDDSITCILEGQLYLSGSTGAENLSQLLELGITHILNITDLIPNYHENEIDDTGKALFTYMNIAIPDCGSIPITDYFPSAFEFINSALSSNPPGRVLVHCFAGKSRSASIVIGYVMQRNGWSFSKAFEYVQSRREVVDPNFGFCAQLLDYEKEIIQTHNNNTSQILEKNSIENGINW